MALLASTAEPDHPRAFRRACRVPIARADRIGPAQGVLATKGKRTLAVSLEGRGDDLQRQIVHVPEPPRSRKRTRMPPRHGRYVGRGGRPIRWLADRALHAWSLASAPVEEPTLGLQTILRRAARRSSALLLVLSPLVEGVAVLAGISDAERALIADGATEAGILAAFVLARTRPGRKRPELPLFLLATVMNVTLLFAAWHLRTEINVYGFLPPVIPLALAAFAPLRPSLFLLLGLQVALLYPIALAVTPSRLAIDPWLYGALSLALATLAASAARSHRELWTALMLAREKALEATRLKSEFLANMSHEIRTPMTAILGFAEELESTIRERGRDGSARAALQTIRRNGDHLLVLINGILDLSKIEAGKLEISRTRFSPLELVADVVQLLSQRARDKRLALVARCDGPVPETILSDAVRLRQIAINLVGNAIKFTNAGSVSLVVRLAAPDSSSGHLLELVIEDTGPGIDAEQQRIVFEPFTQLQSSSTREFSGTGLGLSLSRRLARLLGGDVTVDSSLGSGSRFCVRVAAGPLEDVRMCGPVELAALLGARISRPKELPATLRGRVLVAEDGPDNQRLIRAILTRAGLEVEVVANGALALDRALAALELGEPFDVVLMDMAMPVMDGYEATRRLRARGYGGAIVALTAHAMSGDRERCLEAGCDDYATKPIVRAELLDRLASWLDKGAGDR